MRSSNAPFSEQGFAEIIRDLERHELLLNQGGDTNPGSGTNFGYDDAPTTSQGGEEGGLSVSAAISAHAALTGTAVHGLGTMSTQNANAVAITGGSATGLVALTTGGTGDVDLLGSSLARLYVDASTFVSMSPAVLNLRGGNSGAKGRVSLDTTGALLSYADGGGDVNWLYVTSAGISAQGTLTANAFASSGVAITGGSITGITDLAVADGGTGRSTISADRILYGSSLNVYSETPLTTFGRSLIDDADAAAARTTLGLGSIATIASPVPVANGGTAKTGIAADRFWYASSTDTLSEATITAFGRSLAACADAAAGRTQLSLAAIASSGSGADLVGLSVPTGALAAAAVTNAKLADMAQSTIKGRAVGAGTGVPTDLTATQATAILDEMVASGSSHKKGLVPDPPSSAGSTKFLREDATWAVPTSSATGTFAKVTGGSQTVTSGTSNATITSYSAVGTATLSGLDTTTGIFTAPSDGLYLVTGFVYPTYGAIGTQQWDFYVDRNNASSPDQSFGRFGPYSFSSAVSGPIGGISGARFLTAGDTLRLRISNTGGNTLTIAEAHFNIMKLA